MCYSSGYFLGACTVISGPSTGNTYLNASCSNGNGGTVENSIDVGEYILVLLIAAYVHKLQIIVSSTSTVSCSARLEARRATGEGWTPRETGFPEAEVREYLAVSQPYW